MMTTEHDRVVQSLIAAAISLLDPLQASYAGRVKREDLVPPMKLLLEADSLVDGKDPAREKKNAADRARRAKTKTKPRPKTSKPKSRVTWTGAGEAHTD